MTSIHPLTARDGLVLNALRQIDNYQISVLCHISPLLRSWELASRASYTNPSASRRRNQGNRVPTSDFLRDVKTRVKEVATREYSYSLLQLFRWRDYASSGTLRTLAAMYSTSQSYWSYHAGLTIKMGVQ